jgi:hypothetical protein
VYSCLQKCYSRGEATGWVCPTMSDVGAASSLHSGEKFPAFLSTQSWCLARGPTGSPVEIPRVVLSVPRPLQFFWMIKEYGWLADSHFSCPIALSSISKVREGCWGLNRRSCQVWLPPWERSCLCICPSQLREALPDCILGPGLRGSREHVGKMRMG